MSSIVDDAARPALERAQLVEHPVLRHLEQPRREPRAERESRQALVDAQEDLLRQILGERAVADEPQDVVVDRPLVGPNDDRERSLVAALCFPKDPEVGLLECQGAASIQPIAACITKIYDSLKCHRFAVPAADDELDASHRAADTGRPRSASTVGARSASSPPSRRSTSVGGERRAARGSSCARCAG